MHWTHKTITVAIVAVVLIFGMAATVLAVSMSNRSTPAAAPTPTPTVTQTVQPTTAAPAPTPSTPPPAASGPSIIINNNPPPPSSTVYVPITGSVPAYVTDNQAVIQQYYADLNAHNYQAAWNLGGSNLNGNSGYDAWVAGYDTTSWINLGTWEYYPGSNAVQVSITAGQADGSISAYQGTYSVVNGQIVGANIVQPG